MNRIRLFFENLKNTWLFSLVIFVEITLCICAFAVSYTAYIGSGQEFNFYSSKIADNSYVIFDGYSAANDTSAEKIEEVIGHDLSSLATSVKLGDMFLKGEEVEEDRYYPKVTLVTPALVNNFKKNGVNFSENLNAQYKEAYVSNWYDEKFKIGGIYEVEIGNEYEAHSMKIKVKGYYDNTPYYSFDYRFISSHSADVIICDNLPKDVSINAGIFINENDASFYSDLGFDSQSVKEYRAERLESSSYVLFMFLAIICLIFSFATILCNYVLNVDKITKRSAVMYVCGETKKSIVVMEGLKMTMIYVAAFLVNLIITPIIKAIGDINLSTLITWENFFMSSGIMLAIYVFSIIIGFFKFVRIDPLQVINNEHIE